MQSTTRRTRTVVYLASGSADTCTPDERSLADALARFVRLVWIDPIVPRSGTRIGRAVERIRLDRRVAQVVDTLDDAVSTVIVSDPVGSFPASLDAHRVLYVTDDWVSDAPRHGRSRRYVRRAVARNIDEANTVAAVSRTLADRLHVYTGKIEAVRVVPSGCFDPADTVPLPGSTAGIQSAEPGPIFFAGPLDTRVDYALLDAVARTGHPLVLSGPQRALPADARARLDTILSLPTVTRRDSPPHTRAVGILPLLVDAVTRASFPSDLLGHLASGIPVVSTDLPSARELNTPHVVVARSTEQFVSRTTELASLVPTESDRADRTALASEHTWTIRARTLLGLAGIDVTSHARVGSA